MVLNIGIYGNNGRHKQQNALRGHVLLRVVICCAFAFPRLADHTYSKDAHHHSDDADQYDDDYVDDIFDGDEGLSPCARDC